MRGKNNKVQTNVPPCVLNIEKCITSKLPSKEGMELKTLEPAGLRYNICVITKCCHRSRSTKDLTK